MRTLACDSIRYLANVAALSELRAQRALLATQREGAKQKEVADSLVAVDSALAQLETGGTRGAAANLVALNEQLASVLDIVEGADAVPTTQVVAAAADLERSLDAVLTQWSKLRSSRLSRVKR